MLVLTRKVGQKLVIGDNIEVVVNRISGNRVSLGIQAPGEVHIVRGELQEVRSSFEDDAEPAEQTGAIAPDLSGTFDSFATPSPR